jgi:hypothetical protein
MTISFRVLYNPKRRNYQMPGKQITETSTGTTVQTGSEGTQESIEISKELQNDTDSSGSSSSGSTGG